MTSRDRTEETTTMTDFPTPRLTTVAAAASPAHVTIGDGVYMWTDEEGERWEAEFILGQGYHVYCESDETGDEEDYMVVASDRLLMVIAAGLTI